MQALLCDYSEQMWLARAAGRGGGGGRGGGHVGLVDAAKPAARDDGLGVGRHVAGGGGKDDGKVDHVYGVDGSRSVGGAPGGSVRLHRVEGMYQSSSVNSALSRRANVSLPMLSMRRSTLPLGPVSTAVMPAAATARTTWSKAGVSLRSAQAPSTAAVRAASGSGHRAASACHAVATNQYSDGLATRSAAPTSAGGVAVVMQGPGLTWVHEPTLEQDRALERGGRRGGDGGALAGLDDRAHQQRVGGGGVLGVGDARREERGGGPREHPGRHDHDGRQRKRPPGPRRQRQKRLGRLHKRGVPPLGRRRRVAHQRRRRRRRHHRQPRQHPAHLVLGHVAKVDSIGS